MNEQHEQNYLESITGRPGDKSGGEKPVGDKMPQAPDGLRESWFLLAQLLEAAAPKVDETTVIRAVGRRVRRRQWAAGALALAASLVIGITVVLSRPAAEVQQAKGSPAEKSTKTQSAEVQPSETQAANPAIVKTSAVKTSATAIDVAWHDIVWHDEVDEAMELAQQGMASAQQSWNALPNSIDLVRSQLDDFETRLEQDTL